MEKAKDSYAYLMKLSQTHASTFDVQNTVRPACRSLLLQLNALAKAF